jgi:plastocyanin
MNKKVVIIFSVVVVALLVFTVFMSMQQKSVQNIPANSQPIANVQLETVASKTYQVAIKNFAFDPAGMTVKKGDTITWTNNDSAPHQLVGSGFASEVLSNGATYSFTFNETGKFDYHCSIHPSMTGSLSVE